MCLPRKGTQKPHPLQREERPPKERPERRKLMFRLRIGFDDYSKEATEEFAKLNGFTTEKAQKIMAAEKEVFDYVEPIASAGIVKAIDDTDRKRFFRAIGKSFFEGTDFGPEFVNRKLDRMREKLLDRENAYTFDVFEEWLLVRILKAANYRDPEKEKEIQTRLVDDFGYERKEARMLARALVELTPMQLGYFTGSEDGYWEEENEFFWDYDYKFFDDFGFAGAIRVLAAAFNMGYGYDYTKGIFTDAGFEAPMTLLGTEEGNKERQRAAVNRLAELLN